MTLNELRDVAAQFLGYPDYQGARPDQLWITRAVKRAVYQTFQPEDNTRARWAEEILGVKVPGELVLDVTITQGSKTITTAGELPTNDYAGSFVLIGNDFYTYAGRTSETEGSIVEPFEKVSQTVSARFFHNSIALDSRVVSVLAKPELIGYGNLNELSGKRGEIAFRSIIYNDYWPHDGAFFYNSLAIQRGAQNNMLIGVPNFYFIEDTSPNGDYFRRIVLHPLPQEAHTIRVRASVFPQIPEEGKIPFPGPDEFADVILVPILEKVCSSSKRYAGRNQREIAAEYATALNTLRQFSRSQKRRPTRITLRRGY
jgi:hypothetical protein